MRFATPLSIVFPVFAGLATVQTNLVKGEGRLRNTRNAHSSNLASTAHEERRILQDLTLTYAGNEGLPVNGFPANVFPLDRCQADCDSDSDCQGSLKCFQRARGSTDPIPGCVGNPRGGLDYCYSDGGNTMGGNAALPELFERNESVTSISTKLLELCEGDCDHSGECEGSLRCFQRGGTEAVPGCAGEGEAGKDYCFDPNGSLGGFPTAPATPPPTSLPTHPPSPSPSKSPTPPPSLAPTPPPSTLPTPPPTTRVTSAPTMAPTVAFLGASDNTLLLVGNNVGYLLGECQGDCDVDSDCEDGLKCFQRGSSTKYVPGCLGEAERSWDYCYRSTEMPPPTTSPTTPATAPPTTALPTQLPTIRVTSAPTVAPTVTFQGASENTLVLVGNNVGYRLGECEGDCDNDADCEVGLKCFQRGSSTKYVPGCLEEAEGSWDYCYRSTEMPPPTTSPTTPATAPPTTALPTMPVVTPPPTPVPTQLPTPVPTPMPTSTPTPIPTLLPVPDAVLVTKGNNGSPSSAFPLQMCEGDCDNDGDCAGSLVCFQRSEGDATTILGCTGTPHQNQDYCYDPKFGSFSGAASTPTPTTSPPASNVLGPQVGNNGSPSSVYPLKECQADCDNDDECQGNLRCFQRGEFEAVPGCDGPGDRGRDYCYDPGADESTFDSSTTTPTVGPTPVLPTPSPTPVPTISPTATPPASQVLIQMGNNGSPSNVFPLGKCEGDCDDDAECQGNLQCFQRSALEPVPGCQGSGDGGRDYCYDPGADGTSPSPAPDYFKLKLFWKTGYLWQESPKEVPWCLTCEDGSCKEEKSMLIRHCDNVDTKWEFLQPEGNGTMIKVLGRNLCLERLRVRAVHMALCDHQAFRQRWHAGTGNFLTDERFEITPMKKQGCLSQHHHPKDLEIVYVETCAKAHRADTGYWELLR